jgi:hypothetical protein
MLDGTGTNSAIVCTPVAKSDLGALRATASASSSAFYLADNTNIAATVGSTYTLSGYIRSQNARSATRLLPFCTSGGSTITTTATTAITTSTSAWTRMTVTATAPALTTTMNAYITTTGNTSGQFHYADAAMLTESATVQTYFDGDSTDTSSWL